MHVEELYQLTVWTKREIEAREVIQRYQDVLNILQQNTQPNQAKQPFEKQQKRLFETISVIALHQLNNEQIALLEKIGIARYVGPEAISPLEDVLFRNALDIATAASHFQNAVNDLTSAVQWCKEISEKLAQKFEFAEPEIAEGYLVRIAFLHDAQLGDVKEFKQWGSIWFDIGRGIAMAHGRSPEDVRVVGASRGSIIIELAVCYGIAKTIGKILEGALRIVERCLNIRKTAAEIRELNLRNDKVANELEDEAEQEKRNAVETITNEIVVNLNINTNGEGDKVNAINKSVKNLIDFVDKGGELDCVVPDEEPPGEDAEDVARERYQESLQLRDAFREIRRLENKIRQLEHGP